MPFFTFIQLSPLFILLFVFLCCFFFPSTNQIKKMSVKTHNTTGSEFMRRMKKVSWTIFISIEDTTHRCLVFFTTLHLALAKHFSKSLNQITRKQKMDSKSLYHQLTHNNDSILTRIKSLFRTYQLTNFQSNHLTILFSNVTFLVQYIIHILLYIKC